MTMKAVGLDRGAAALSGMQGAGFWRMKADKMLPREEGG